MTEWREVDEPKIWASLFPRSLDQVSFGWTCAGEKLDFIHASQDRLQPVEAHMAPESAFFARHSKIPVAVKDAFKIKDGLLVISKGFRDVLMQFDMEGVQFFEVPIHADENGTLTDLPNHYVLNVYGAKNALIPELSENIEHPWIASPETPLRTDVWTPGALADVVALSETAANGPDLWRDPLYINTLFFSDRLKKEIDASGLKTKALSFAPTRVFTRD